MKKLMMAVAIVCAAVSAQAVAILNWSSVPVDIEGNEFTGGQAYLIMVTDAEKFAVADDLTITGGSIVDSTIIDASYVAGSWTTEELTGGQDYLFAILATTEGTDEGLPTTGYYGVDKNGGNATDFYTVTWDANAGGSFEPNYEGDYAYSMDTKVTPEPTSGLLLLLGMAGLALKRKRA